MLYLVVWCHYWFKLGTITALGYLATAYQYDVYYLIIRNVLFWSIYYGIPYISFRNFNGCIIAFYLLRKNVIF